MSKRKDNKRRVLKDGEYQRKDGYYEFRYRDKNGKRHSIYSKTLEGLREKEDYYRKKVALNIEPSHIKIDDLFISWKNAKVGLKKTTMEDYEAIYIRHIKPVFGNVKAEELKYSDIRSRYIWLLENDVLSPNSVSSIHNVLHQILETGVRDGWLLKNPSHGAFENLSTIYKEKTKKRLPLSKAEEQLFVKYLNSSPQHARWRQFFLCLLYTGARLSELSSLTWKDVSFKKGYISITHTMYYPRNKEDKSTSLAVGTPKSFSGKRKIPMSAETKKLLLDEKKYQMDNGIFSDGDINGYSGFVFVGNNGKPRVKSIYRHALSVIILKCNEEQARKGETLMLPKFTCHCLRHTFATRLVGSGVPLEIVKAVMGHSKIETTMNTYVTPDDEEIKKRLEEFFKSHSIDAVF